MTIAQTLSASTVSTMPARVTSTAKPILRRTTSKKVEPDHTEFKAWLAALEGANNPTLHINGKAYTSCLLTVDFGTPLESYRLDNAQQSDLVNFMRQAGRAILSNENASIRCTPDNSNGVWFASLG